MKAANMRSIIKHLNPRRASMTENAIGILEAGVEAGEIKNALYLGAKETISRAMSEAAEAFLATGPHAQHHHMSDWWLVAHQADAFLSGPAYLGSALKRAKAAYGLKEYTAFLESLLPLADLLAKAKPLAVKRQSGPGAPKTAKQLEREAATMTCQCCGRRHLANNGVIAHHGYTRPGHGWQTASCMGARAVPFEAGRTTLGVMIVRMTDHLKGSKRFRASTRGEAVPIHRTWSKRDPKTREKVEGEFNFSARNFDSPEGKEAARKIGFHGTWADLKKAELERQDRQIKALADDIAQCQARFDGWKRTHTWDHANKLWAEV